MASRGYKVNKNIALTFDEKSLTQFDMNIKNATQLVLLGAESGMQHIVDLIYTRSWATCKMRTGSLRASLYKEVEVDGNVINAIVGHGGKHNMFNVYTGKFTDEYAVEAHETPGVSSESARMGSTWKWLEKAVNSTSLIMLPVIQEHISSSLSGASGKDLNAAVNKVYEKVTAERREKRANYFKKLDTQREARAKTDEAWQQRIKDTQQ